jgi:hypothetical protein
VREHAPGPDAGVAKKTAERDAMGNVAVVDARAIVRPFAVV